MNTDEHGCHAGDGLSGVNKTIFEGSCRAGKSQTFFEMTKGIYHSNVVVEDGFSIRVYGFEMNEPETLFRKLNLILAGHDVSVHLLEDGNNGGWLVTRDLKRNPTSSFAESDFLRRLIEKMRFGILCAKTFLGENPNIENALKNLEEVEELSALADQPINADHGRAAEAGPGNGMVEGGGE